MDKSTTMPFSGLQRSPWRLVLALACLMFAPVVTASIAPSNSTTAVDFPGTLPLQHAEDSKARLAEVVPLTQRARGTSATGNLVYLQFSNRTNIAIGDIAYISCNQDDYSGFDTPQQVLEDAYQRSDFSGVIFYSTATNYCNYQMQDNQKMLQEFPMFSMTDKQDSASLLDAISRSTTGSKLSVVIHGRDGSNTTASNPLNQPNPLGPSPSTAVAMIILYSITGIITALFLVIIVTGAIRAHRHPERYGPRNVLGRPRQSRARGLGRAILDTIPIVKFGEKEPTKPADVELASTAASNQTLPTPEAAETTREAPLARVDEQDEQDEQQEGIAPAQPAMAAAATGKDNASHDDSLGCSICTEDFEMGQDLRVLPCDHKFHPECVDPWLLNVSGTCPLCRVDLRPVTSNASSTPDADTDAGAGADPSDPPPASGSDPPHRSAFRDILSLRNRPNATPQERIYYLRRLREQRRNRSSEAGEQTDNALDRRRSKSMNVRLSGVFGARARGERSLQQMEESSTPAAAQQQQRNDDPSAVHETDARAGSLA